MFRLKKCLSAGLTVLIAAAVLSKMHGSLDDAPWTGEARATTIVIVGGKPVPPGLLPSTVAIFYGAYQEPDCTGSLIERDIVLTAAHCICGQLSDVDEVFVGTNFRDRSGPKSGRYYEVTDQLSAITWRGNETERECALGLKRGRDVALLRLRKPVPDVPPVRAAAHALISRASSYRVAGFGATNSEATQFPADKHEASVAALSNRCVGAAGGTSAEAFYGCQPGEEIVAGRRYSPDTCRGDSGGPLLVTSRGDAGSGPGDSFQLAGVTSRAVESYPETCGSGGIYERLTPAALQWIDSGIRELRSR